MPFILREQEEELVGKELDVTTLPEFKAMTFEQLKATIGKGDVFRSKMSRRERNSATTAWKAA